MKCVQAVLGEFSSGVSVCRNKGTQSDLGAPFFPAPPRPGVTGGPSSGSAHRSTKTIDMGGKNPRWEPWSHAAKRPLP